MQLTYLIYAFFTVWGQYASSAGRGQYAYSASPMGGGYQGGGGGGGYGGGGGCAVIIPDKVKGGKNHICIPWKVFFIIILDGNSNLEYAFFTSETAISSVDSGQLI